MPVILATQEAEIRRISVQSWPRQIVDKTLSQTTLYKNRAGRVAQDVGPEFKSQYCKKKSPKSHYLSKKSKDFAVCSFVLTIHSIRGRFACC
jgi:hypothetical protein